MQKCMSVTNTGMDNSYIEMPVLFMGDKCKSYINTGLGAEGNTSFKN